MRQGIDPKLMAEQRRKAVDREGRRSVKLKWGMPCLTRDREAMMTCSSASKVGTSGP